MASNAYCRYANRTANRRAGLRYDVSEIWIVPDIQNTGSPSGGDSNDWKHAWQSEALAAEKLPKPGNVNADGGLVCVSVSPKSCDDQGTAYVDVRWQEDPLTLPTEVHYFSGSKTRPAWQGVAMDPGNVPNDGESGELWDFDPTEDIRNSAGDRFNPPLAYDVPLERVEICFHASLLWHDTGETSDGSTNFSGNWEKYLKRWNKSDFTVVQVDPDNDQNSSTRTFPKGSLMLVDKRAPLVKEPYYHRLVTLAFLYDPDLWGTRIPDMGPRCYKHASVDAGGNSVLAPWPGNGLGPVTDAMGRPYSGVAELDGAGNQLLPDHDGHMPSAVIYQWWPVNDLNELLSAEFDDLDLFTPERVMSGADA